MKLPMPFLAEGLLAGDASLTMAGKPLRLDLPGLVRARDFLDNRHSVVRSAELGSTYGVTPKRYALLRAAA